VTYAPRLSPFQTVIAQDSQTQTLFDKLGGEPRLRAIIDTFIDRVFEDRMIGFFFRNADRRRIKEFEYQLAAAFLGADVEYRGRPLGKAHANHPIMGGHFARRRQILSETLDFYEVAPEIKAVMLRHTDALREQITSETGSGCDPNLVRDRTGRG
jgi:hemoglobin